LPSRLTLAFPLALGLTDTLSSAVSEYLDITGHYARNIGLFQLCSRVVPCHEDVGGSGCTPPPFLTSSLYHRKMTIHLFCSHVKKQTATA
jgi:hypothetical protein